MYSSCVYFPRLLKSYKMHGLCFWCWCKAWLKCFPNVGIVMTFIFTPGKQGIALLSLSTSQKAPLANLCPRKNPSYLGVLGWLRMFRKICLVSHTLTSSSGSYRYFCKDFFISHRWQLDIKNLILTYYNEIQNTKASEDISENKSLFKNLYISSPPDLEFIYCNQEVTVK